MILLSRSLIPIDAERFVDNGATPQPPASPEATALYERLRVVDLHADSLLWRRDLAVRSGKGLVDIPRHSAHGIAVQVYMAVVEAPSDVTGEAIPEEGDKVRMVAFLDGWPMRTWFSPRKRAFYLADKLKKVERDRPETFKLLLSHEELEDFLSRRESDRKLTAGLLGLEGAHATGWRVDGLDRLHEAGFRSLSLAHYSDTPFAGSSSGEKKSGLTPLGRAAVRRMNELGMLVDVAHTSEDALTEIIATSERPVYASHVGIRATCNHARNLSDKALGEIAEQGGVIGVGFFREAICGSKLSGVVDAILHVRDQVGAEFVALGSGFDVAPLPLGPQDLDVLVDRLLQEGLTNEEVAGVMGENFLRYLDRAWR
ncbi:MAG: membrane dipeptidase [Myxococcota bacterium]